MDENRTTITIGEDVLVLSARYAKDALDVQEYVSSLTDKERAQNYLFIGCRVIADSLKRTRNCMPRIKRKWFHYWKRDSNRAKYAKYSPTYLLERLTAGEILIAQANILELEAGELKKKAREAGEESEEE